MVKSKNKIAQLMYSMFSTNEIYVAAAYGMGRDIRCESKTGIPDELTPEEFEKCIQAVSPDFPAVEKIDKFTEKYREIHDSFLRKHGKHYEDERGMTPTERYAFLYLYEDMSYRWIGTHQKEWKVSKN